MTAITVAPDAGAEAVTSTVLSSLPLSYAAADHDAAPRVAVVAGTLGWPVAVQRALQEGSVAAIVVHPEPANLGATLATPGLVLVDSIWAGNPAVSAASGHFRAAAADAQLLECRVISGPNRSLRANLVDLAALVRELIGPLHGVSLLHHDHNGCFAVAGAGDLSVGLGVVRCTAVAPQASVRVLTNDGGVELSLPDPSTARPAEVVITNGDGSRLLPTVWESGHRAAWRRLQALLTSGETAMDLRFLEEDQLAVATALRHLDR
jgi:hypothetical protein